MSQPNLREQISYLMDKVSDQEIALQREKHKRRKREAELKKDLDHSWEELKNLGEELEAQKLENEKMRRFLEVHFGFVKGQLDGTAGSGDGDKGNVLPAEVCAGLGLEKDSGSDNPMDDDNEVEGVGSGSILSANQEVADSNDSSYANQSPTVGDQVVVKIEQDEDVDMTRSYDSDGHTVSSSDDTPSLQDFKIRSVSHSLSSLKVNSQDGSKPGPSHQGSSQSSSPAKKKQRLSADNKDSTVKVKMNFFKCHLCPKEYPIKKKLDSHLRRRHNYEEPAASKQKSIKVGTKTLENGSPKKLSKNAGKLNKQADDDDGDPAKSPLKCSHCSVTFASKKSLDRHLAKHTPFRKKRYFCPVLDCHRHYLTQENFQKHIKSHGDPDKLTQCVCPECAEKKEFNSVKEYMEHVQAEHDGRQPRRSK